MRIGRLEFGTAIGFSYWGFQKGSCGCLLLDLGKFYVTWLHKDCKCNSCKQYKCVCPYEEVEDEE